MKQLGKRLTSEFHKSYFYCNFDKNKLMPKIYHFMKHRLNLNGMPGFEQFFYFFFIWNYLKQTKLPGKILNGKTKIISLKKDQLDDYYFSCWPHFNLF